MYSSFRLSKQSVPRPTTTPEPSTSKSSSSTSLVDARGNTLVACNTCRARKLKCSGGKDSCSRCRASGIVCTYPQGPRATAGRKRSRPRPENHNAILNTSESTSSSRSATCTPPPPPYDVVANSLGMSELDYQNNIGYFLGHRELEALQDAPSRSFNSSISDAAETDFHTGLDYVDQELVTHETLSKLDFDVGLTSPMAPDTTARLSSDTLYTNSTLWPPSPRSGFDFPVPEGDWTSQISSNTGSSISPPSILPSTPTGCNGTCLASTVRLLEEVGKQRSYVATTSMDGLMKCLQQATGVCAVVLACTSCSIFTNNAMLLATVVQQLSSLCTDIGELLMSSRTEQNSPRSMPTSSNSQTIASSLLRGNISIGSYTIDSFPMRDALVRRLVLCQFTDLHGLLTRIKSVVGRNDSAWRLIAEAREQVHKVFCLVQDLDASHLDQS